MLTRHRAAIVVPIVLAMLPATTFSQAPRKSTASESSSTAHGGLDLAERGGCRDALPLLTKSGLPPAARKVRLKLGVALTGCALPLDQVGPAGNARLGLNGEFL